MVEDMVEGIAEEEEDTTAVVVVVVISKEDMVVAINKEDMVEEDTVEEDTVEEDTVEVEVEATKVAIFVWFLKSTDMVCIQENILAWAGNVIVIALIMISFLCFLSSQKTDRSVIDARTYIFRYLLAPTGFIFGQHIVV